MPRFAALLAGLLLLLLAAGPAAAGAVCIDGAHQGLRYTACRATAGQDVRLFHTAPDGQPYGSFDRINRALDPRGQRLIFAMNAGMYHRDRRPVGLLIEDGVERMRLITAEGPGNFGLLPNGVFCVTGAGFAVIESRSFGRDRPACRHATQSGPMALIGGAPHPRFLADSVSRYVRNGVGVTRDGGTAVFVITRDRVNFAEFAAILRDGLGLWDALYFDGNVSRLFAPELGRDDFGFPMGPVVGLVGPRDPQG